jgi:hypothetical protein
MNQSITISRQDTKEIPLDQWIPFLAELTRENRGAHARLEIVGLDAGYQVETEDRPFDGISADVKDRERTVWIAFGSTAADHLTHGIHNAVAIRLGPKSERIWALLDVEAQDGTRTLLELSDPLAFALPPGEQQRTKG